MSNKRDAFGMGSQSLSRPMLNKRLSTDDMDVLNSREHAGGKGAVGQTSSTCGDCLSGLAQALSCGNSGVGDCNDDGDVDVLLVGGGIMSATLGLLIKQLEPKWKVRIYERLSQCGEEASNGWNNAGTGHSALCELNYTPEDKKTKTIDISKAIAINEKFQVSRQYWAYLVAQRLISSSTNGGSVKSWINTTPHMTFVHGEENCDFLKRRFDLLKAQPLFDDMEYSEDLGVIRKWAPLLSGCQSSNARSASSNEKIACTYVEKGTDIDYGQLTKQLIKAFQDLGGEIRMNSEIQSLSQDTIGANGPNGQKIWRVNIYKKDLSATRLSECRSRFVFVGAGGASLQVLQKAGIPEIEGFGGFPISGEFLVCQNPEIIAKHPAKIYGKAAVGAPPMSVPHLDARVIDGKEMILFGPYAGFSPKYLKTGSYMDMFSTLKPHNIIPMAAAGLQNLDLTVYLIKELLATKEKKLEALKEFIPDARGEDWTVCTAGQRVQIMKKDPKKWGILQFGTEVVAGGDGTIAGLLGASPGASVSVQVALDVLTRCFPEKIETGEWNEKLQQMIPSFGTNLSENPSLAKKIMSQNAAVLQI